MTPEYENPPFRDFFIGLDLGKTHDFTAAAVIERSGQPGAYRYDVVGLERVRGRLYPEVIKAVQALVADPGLRPMRLYPASDVGPERLEWAPPATLIVDGTGVGDPIVDQLLAVPLAAIPVPIRITGGSTWRRDKWPGAATVQAYWVAKSLLVSTVQVLLQSGRLRIVPTLSLARDLEAELLNFEVKISEVGNESCGAWRSGTHDDLVLACALALWFAELKPVVPPTIVFGPNPLDRVWGTEGDSPRRTRRPNDPMRGFRSYRG